MGRGFTLDDEIPGQGQVVILSQGIWERRFGSDPDILGRAISVGEGEGARRADGGGGGYPEMIRREDEKRRQAWARDYPNTLIRRDVGNIAKVGREQGMVQMFRILAHHSAQLVNFSQVGGQAGLDDKTVRRYILILEQLFLLRRLEPWFRNRVRRLVKTPKPHLLDSGLLAASSISGTRTNKKSMSWWKTYRAEWSVSRSRHPRR